MSSDIHIRKTGRAGRITLTRPEPLNALTYDMCLKIEAALDSWVDDDDVALVIIDAQGAKAFCAGGDIAEMYRTASAGDFDYGRKFWADEYRINAKIFNFPKPYVAFMQGFNMGGGVGVSCHGSHRVVCASSKISMPECGIGLVPDVGGSLLLARAPGRLGEYLATTGTRMGPGDAIYAEFADYYLPEDQWPGLIATLENTGDYRAIDAAAQPVPDSPLKALQPEIDTLFSGETIGDIVRSLIHQADDFSMRTLKTLHRQSPLSLACAVELIHRVRGPDSIQTALELEYRFTYRSAEHADFIEGIRAAIVDRDNAPNWLHPNIEAVSSSAMSAMLMPLGQYCLKM